MKLLLFSGKTIYIRFFLLFFLCFRLGFSQEKPPISNFDTKSYDAGNQNWMISQGDEGKIYIANNSGLLVYNGEQWQLNKVPNGSSVRSVLVMNDRIYTGSYMDFGYWEHQKNGELDYYSLKSHLKDSLFDGEQFWHIQSLGDYVVFQSLNNLYSYHEKDNKITVIPSDNTIINLFKLEGKLYYQVVNEGLYAIDNGTVELTVPAKEIESEIVVGLFRYKGDLMLVTRSKGAFIFKDNEWSAFGFEEDTYPISESIFTANFLEKQNTLVLGSIGHGLYIIDLETGTTEHFLQPSILNNTILSLYEDNSGNIWCGLDNGVSVINKQSPFQLYTDIFGEIGTVYSAYQQGNFLYIGTNQGLYVRDVTSKSKFKMLSGTSGQVWTVNSIEGQLYMGHDKGTFKINGDKAIPIFNESGTWEIKQIDGGILQGHYNGLTYFKTDQLATEIQYLKGFDLSSRNIVVQNDSVVWVGHDHKGVYKLLLDKEITKVKSVVNYEVPIDEGLGLTVLAFNDSIYYSTAKHVYKYLPNTKQFTTQNKLQNLIQEQPRISGISKVLGDKTWWSFGADGIFYVTNDAFQNKLTINKISLPIEYRNIASGFENISLLGDKTYLIGSNVGYCSFKLPLPKTPKEKLSITLIEVADKDGAYFSKPLSSEQLKLANKKNFIRFSYSVPQFNKLNNIKYSHRLLNFSEEWSAWESASTASFKNLSAGDYTFEVRAIYNDEIINTESFRFSIAKPWYASIGAIMVYILLFLLLIYIVHRLYVNYYQKQHDQLMERNRKQLELKQLEAQQEIVTLQNQQLEADVASKNRELAASTMNLIKKNEFLNELKTQLSNAENKKQIQEVISIINKNIAEKDNWKLFKEAFDNADKDFLQSVKKKHPNLTSNDLKLCAYLRLNLSSKEIAPLLNISIRSVEIKRYRLRKKMDLEHEQGLVEYILRF